MYLYKLGYTIPYFLKQLDELVKLVMSSQCLVVYRLLVFE